jgi:hypothetical protein
MRTVLIERQSVRRIHFVFARDVKMSAIELRAGHFDDDAGAFFHAKLPGHNPAPISSNKFDVSDNRLSLSLKSTERGTI